MWEDSSRWRRARMIRSLKEPPPTGDPDAPCTISASQLEYSW